MKQSCHKRARLTRPKRAERAPSRDIQIPARTGNEHYAPAQFVDALVKSHGLIAPAARALGCARNTISEAMERHPEIGEAVKDTLDAVKDLAEEKLIKHIKAGHPWAIAFFLKTKAKDRGYGERQEMTGPVSTSLEPAQADYSLEHLSLTEKEQLYALLLKAKARARKLASTGGN